MCLCRVLAADLQAYRKHVGMGYVIAWICLGIYLLCSAWLLISILFQLHLLVKSSSRATTACNDSLPNLPTITIQVPVYNEKNVISQLLRALAHLDYPQDRFEVQVLDDSTDQTSAIIDNEVTRLRQTGLRVNILRRAERKNYKAGALQAGMQCCTGEFILILDADFIPGPDILLKMVKHFDDPRVGTVQARWVHNNAAENLLTRVQVFLLDTHFTIEQNGRSRAGYLVNFNGTAGMWRRKCIEELGGWMGDILTEDLELSYRAQLKGWWIKYDNSIIVPADLPEHVSAFKSQQFRWAKGMAQTLIIHARSLFSKSMPLDKKFHAFFHLSGSCTFLAVMGVAFMSIPVLFGRHFSDEFRETSYIILLTGVTLPFMCIYYYFGTVHTISRRTFWTHLPLFLIIYMALSVQNSIAVTEAFLGRKTAFIRTPKLRNTVTGSEYIDSKWTFINTIELFMACYMAVGLILSIWWSDYFLFLFYLMMFAGLTILLAPSVSFPRGTRARRFVESSI